MILANEPYTDQLYWQKSTWFLFTSNLLWHHSILRGSIDQKHAKTNEIWRQNSEIHPAFACSRWPPWFPDLSRPYGACVKRGSGKHVRSQSFSSESAVKYLHVGRRKIQISPPLGEQDQSNALPQGQQRQSNPHPMPSLPCPQLAWHWLVHNSHRGQRANCFNSHYLYIVTVNQ